MATGNEKASRLLGWSAAAGFAAWCVLGHAVHKRWTTLGLEYGEQLFIIGVFILAPLVNVPLALKLAEPSGRGSGAWRLAAWLQPPAAAAAFMSIFLPVGALSASLILPWIAVGACATAAAVGRLHDADGRRIEEISASTGLLLLLPGTLALAASRAGINLFGYEEPYVLLLAVHLHFAGLTAPVIVGQAGRRLRAWKAWGFPLYFALAAGVSLGVPILVAGLALHSKPVEVGGALLLAFALGGYCFFTLFLVLPRLPGRLSRVLLAVALGCAIWSMHHAGHYTMGVARGSTPPLYTRPRMEHIHGLLNAVGFSLLGLLGWLATRRAERRSGPPA